MKHFKNIETITELKREYYKLAKVFHPDLKTGNLQIMQEINNEYDLLFNALKAKIDYTYSAKDNNNNTDYSKVNYTYKAETSDIFKDIISKIIHLENVSIEICGYWLWLTGDTKPYAKYLGKDGCGFFWSSKKFAWYWRPEEYKSFNKTPFSMDKIREMYGSVKVENEKNEKIIA